MLVQSTDDITGDDAAPRNGTEAQRGVAQATRKSARIAQMGVGRETMRGLKTESC